MRKEDSLLWQEIHEQDECIKRCLKYNTEIIKNLASEVKRREIKEVVFVARGSSEHASQIAKYVFDVKTDFITNIASPSVVTCYNGKTNYKNALVIGISQSGEARDVYEVMQKAIKDGALVVSVTNEIGCLMSTIGDFIINNQCGPEKSITAAKSYMTQVIILLAICAYISEDQELLDLIDEASDIVKKAYELEDQVEKIIPYFRNTEHLMVFGRGYLYGLALETELKIQETCYLDARCYAASDYQHGPIATTKRFVPALMFIADKNTNDSIIKLQKRLVDEHNVSTIIITNDEEIAKLGVSSILIPKECDGIKACIVGAVISQMFACLLSIARGYNPDFPTGVSKHTITI